MSICMYVLCVWNHEKWDTMMACISNSLCEYVNIFLNGYILAKHQFFLHIKIVFQVWSSSCCAKSGTSTMNAPKFWTSDIWGLGWRSSLWLGMWLCGTRLMARVSRHDTCVVGLCGVMVEWLLASKRKAKKESMVKTLRSSVIVNKNYQNRTLNRGLHSFHCLAMPHPNFAHFMCA